jgi:mannitol/fructose-specific phosphotransferase system IIA component (Ntr-type)
MELYEILSKRSCAVDLRAKNKDEALEKLAELAVKSDQASGIGVETIYERLRDRESQGSTGFGNEFAIPHARIPGMEEFLLYIAVFPKGVDFDALDKKRVKLFFVILGPPEAVNEHLKILAAVSRAVAHTHAKAEILRSPSVTGLYEAFLRNMEFGSRERREQRTMQLLVLNLYDEDLLYAVLEIFIEEGVEGATILDSAGMGQYISNVPLFADFIGFMRENKHQSKTILTLVPQENTQELIQRVEEVSGDLDKKQGAMIMVLDVSYLKGSMKMI